MKRRTKTFGNSKCCEKMKIDESGLSSPEENEKERTIIHYFSDCVTIETMNLKDFQMFNLLSHLCNSVSMKKARKKVEKIPKNLKEGEILVAVSPNPKTAKMVKRWVKKNNPIEFSITLLASELLLDVSIINWFKCNELIK